MYELLLYLLFTLSVAGFALLAGFVVALAYGRYYWDGAEFTGARRSKWFRKLPLWRFFVHYFNVTTELHPEVSQMPPKARVLFVQYPHGFSPLPFIALMLTARDSPLAPWFKNIYLAGASAIAWVPGLRDFCLAGGYIDVGRDALRNFCRDRPDANLAISPGGMREMVRARYGRDDLYVGHTGFLKLARDAGFDYVVPIFVERQTDAFFCGRWLMPVRDWTLTHIGVPLPSFVIPFPLPTSCKAHVGRPVRVPATDADKPWLGRLDYGHEFAESLLGTVQKADSRDRVRIWTRHTLSFTLQEDGLRQAVRDAFAQVGQARATSYAGDDNTEQKKQERPPWHSLPDTLEEAQKYQPRRRDPNRRHGWMQLPDTVEEIAKGTPLF